MGVLPWQWKKAMVISGGLAGFALLPMGFYTRLASIAILSLSFLYTSRTKSLSAWGNHFRKWGEILWIGPMVVWKNGGREYHAVEKEPLPGLCKMVMFEHMSRETFNQSKTNEELSALLLLFRQEFVLSWIDSVSIDPTTLQYIDAVLECLKLKLIDRLFQLDRADITQAVLHLITKHCTYLNQLERGAEDEEDKPEDMGYSSSEWTKKVQLLSFDEWVKQKHQLTSLEDHNIALMATLLDARTINAIVEQSEDDIDSTLHINTKPSTFHEKEDAISCTDEGEHPRTEEPQPFTPTLMACIDSLLQKTALEPLVDILSQPRILLRMLILIYVSIERGEGRPVDCRAEEIADRYEDVLERICHIKYPSRDTSASQDMQLNHDGESALHRDIKIPHDATNRISVYSEAPQGSLLFTVAVREALLKHNVVLFSVDMWRVFADNEDVLLPEASNNELDNWVVLKSQEDILKLHKLLKSRYPRHMFRVRAPPSMSSRDINNASRKEIISEDRSWEEANSNKTNVSFEGAVVLSSRNMDQALAAVDDYFQSLIAAGLGATQALSDFFSSSTTVEEKRAPSLLYKAAKKGFSGVSKVVRTMTAVVRVPVAAAVRAFSSSKIISSSSRIVFVRRRYQSEEYDFIFRNLAHSLPQKMNVIEEDAEEEDVEEEGIASDEIAGERGGNHHNQAQALDMLDTRNINNLQDSANVSAHSTRDNDVLFMIPSLSPSLLLFGKEFLLLHNSLLGSSAGLLHILLSGVIDRWLVDVVDEQLCDASIADYLHTLIDTFWRDGKWIDDEPEIPESQELDDYLCSVACDCLPLLLPFWMRMIIGRKRLQDRISSFAQALKVPKKNRKLISELIKMFVGKLVDPQLVDRNL